VSTGVLAAGSIAFDPPLPAATQAAIHALPMGLALKVALRATGPDRLGLPLHPTSALRGGDPAHNAQVVRSVFGGETGAVRDAVLLNAGLALALTGTDSGSSADEFEADVRAGMARATEAVDSGAATRLVESWVAATRSG